jgi:biopolymer transport protein ExbD
VSESHSTAEDIDLWRHVDVIIIIIIIIIIRTVIITISITCAYPQCVAVVACQARAIQLW